MYTGYYIPRDDGVYGLVCILTGGDKIDYVLADTMRHSVEGRLAGSAYREEWKKIEGLDPKEFSQVLIMEDINDI